MLSLSRSHTAVLAIDLHRGHLDPDVATMPVPRPVAARILSANRALFEGCRERGVRVVAALTAYRDVAEIRSNPFWRSAADAGGSRSAVERHNIIGGAGCELMPDLFQEPADWVVDTKKRYDCFRETDLNLLLRAHAVEALLITGVNTNSCVLATAAAACCLDYQVNVVSDCVASMDGEQLHDAALACVGAAFGEVIDSQQVFARLDGGE
jgi:biuret amidohydrolase